MATRSKQPVNSRRKGKRAELAAKDFLIQLGFPDAQRTVQHCGRTGEASDLRCPQSLPDIHFEVKCVRGMELGTKLLDSAIAQAQHDAGKSGKRWVVLWRRHGSSCWLLTSGLGPIWTLHRPSDIRATLENLQDEP